MEKKEEDFVNINGGGDEPVFWIPDPPDLSASTGDLPPLIAESAAQPTSGAPQEPSSTDPAQNFENGTQDDSDALERARAFYAPATFKDAPKVVPRGPDTPLPPLTIRRDWGRIKVDTKRFDELVIGPASYPTEGLIPTYLAWATDSTDAPDAYHLAAILTGVATCLGRNTFYREGGKPTAPRVYSLIVGESGTRKSVAARLLRRVLPDLTNDASFGSQEAFIDALVEQPHQLGFLLEGAELFRRLGQTYTRQLTQKLCVAFDGDPLTSRSRKAGTTAAADHLYSLFIATTDAGIMPSNDREGARELVDTGLAGRLWIFAGAQARQYFEQRTPDAAVEDWLRDQLERLYQTNQTREIGFSEKAQVELRVWLEQTQKMPAPKLEGWWERRGVHVKKIAFLYHVSRGIDAGNLVDADTMKCAISLAHYFLIPGHTFVLTKATRTASQTNVIKMRQALNARQNGIRVSELKELLGLKDMEFLDTIVGINNEIHYELWKQLPRGRGKPHYVVVYGRKPLDNNARGAEFRMLNGADVAPPTRIQRAMLDAPPAVSVEPPIPQ